jgi:hypothetical protein
MSKKKQNIEVSLDDIRFTFNGEEVEAVAVSVGKNAVANIVEITPRKFHAVAEGEILGNYHTFEDALEGVIAKYNLEN